MQCYFSIYKYYFVCCSLNTWGTPGWRDRGRVGLTVTTELRQSATWLYAPPPYSQTQCSISSMNFMLMPFYRWGTLILLQSLCFSSRKLASELFHGWLVSVQSYRYVILKQMLTEFLWLLVEYWGIRDKGREIW